VVNCVGVLQDGARDNTRRVQIEATCALFDACVRSRIRRVVHISAIGAERAGPTQFARSKALADDHLAKLELPAVILRLGLVLASAVYGGSAMLRGLAGLPLATPLIAGDSRMLIVGIEDVVATVAFALKANAPAKAIWDVAHPEPVTLGAIVVALRQWLGFPSQKVLAPPRWAARLVSAVADALGWLGWRSPARSTSLQQLAEGMHADPVPWMAATGIQPKDLDQILAAQPATVQDRWHARLYFLRPLALAGLSAYWIATGLISLGPGWQEGLALLTPTFIPQQTAGLMIAAGALLDIVLGAALLVRSLTRPVLIVMLLVCAAYLVAATIIDPSLWIDPLGRMTKTLIVMIATTFTLAVLDER
jgi:nucleoside-diphosphate-sugar epimerase